MLKLAQKHTKGKKRFAQDLSLGMAKEVERQEKDGVVQGFKNK